MILNPEQQAAVDTKAGKVLVLAGPGSGKSSTLVARILKLIERGAKPEEIVCITYTRSAAAEIQKRLGELYASEIPPKEQPEPLRLAFCGTLHAFAFQLLAKHGTLIGLPQRLSVADDEQREGLVETIASEMGIKVSAKNVLPLLARSDLIEQRPGNKTKSELIAAAYHLTLRAAGLLDFDAMLYYCLKLIQRQDLEWPFKHLLVDEVQDSSDADMAIYGSMPCETKFMVGDADQAIYSFRGGNVANIIKLSDDKSWKVFALERNYRCKSVICERAQRLINHNPLRYPKITLADEPGGAVVVESFKSPAEELGFLAKELAATSNGKINGARNDNDDCAVLCRTNALARQVAEYLKSLGIPVAEKKEVIVPGDWRRAKLLLSVMASPWSDFTVHQYLVASVGRKKADMIKLKAAGAMDSINGYLGGKFTATLDSSMLADEKISMESRQRIHDAARKLSGLASEWSIPELIMFINSQEDVSQEVGSGVTVTTMHSSKGREFSTVYLAGFEDETIPGKKCGDDPSEERRLAFVACTRAKQRLVISYCTSRPQSRGPNLPPGDMQPRSASRFIGEMLRHANAL